MEKTNFTISEAFIYGWDVFKANTYFWLQIMFIYIFILLLPLFFKSFQDPSLQIIISGCIWVMSSVVSLGITKICLKFYDGDQPLVNDLFSLVYLFIRYLLCSILYFIIVVAGLLLLVVPGILLAVRLHFYQIILVDKELGPIEALKGSFLITKEVTLKLIGFLVLSLILQIGGIAAFGIGFLVTFPVTVLAHVSIYRKLGNL